MKSNDEPNIHKQVKFNPNNSESDHNSESYYESESFEFDHNSESYYESESFEFDHNSGSDNESEPFESDRNSESDNGSEGFPKLVDNLIEGLSSGRRFAVTNFILELGLPRNIDFNTIIDDNFILQYPLCGDLLDMIDDGIARSIAESIALIMQNDIRARHLHNLPNLQNIQINDNLTTDNLNFMLQAIQHRLEDGMPLNNLAIINNWGYRSDDNTEQLLLNIASLPNRPQSLSILNSDINANNLINVALANVPAVARQNLLIIDANVDPDLLLHFINNPANANLNIHINQEDVNDYIVGDHPNRRIPNLQEITENFHDDLRDIDNESAIYNFIQGYRNIYQEIPEVIYPNPINLNNYPGLLEHILDSVRNGGENLIINENNLTANSINLILQGILDGLNACPPQFQGLQSLQISNNDSNGDNVGMDEESMNLLLDIISHQNNHIRNLDIRNSNIDPNNLNILLEHISLMPPHNPNVFMWENANNQNLRELDFSLNLINRASVPLLNTILRRHQNIIIEAEHSIPEGIELGNLANHPRFNPELELPANNLTLSTISGRSRINSLDSLNNNQL
jgi:hypothetical protein